MNPIWTRFWVKLGPQGPNSGWVGSGWASRVQIRPSLCEEDKVCTQDGLSMCCLPWRGNTTISARVNTRLCYVLYIHRWNFYWLIGVDYMFYMNLGTKASRFFPVNECQEFLKMSTRFSQSALPGINTVVIRMATSRKRLSPQVRNVTFTSNVQSKNKYLTIQVNWP